MTISEHISHILDHLPAAPGIYRMVDESGEVIYVGKARDLSKRVRSYFTGGAKASRTLHMVNRVQDIQISVTRTESEALLLESQLIKELKPRYNVLLRDDKSYPFITLSQHDYPRIGMYRGPRKRDQRHFGPYPSASAVREAIDMIQKVFKLRGCRDSYFKNRSRPCLQYQISRCSAPCVDYISAEEYAQDVRDAELFLKGQSHALVESLIQRMEQASKALEFEQAAAFRDQIARLKRVQQKQFVSASGGNVDVLAVRMGAGVACVQLMSIRDGQNLGTRGFFPNLPRVDGQSPDESVVLEAFISQHYSDYEPPGQILVSHALPDHEALEAMLGEHAGHRVRIQHRLRGDRRQWLAMAEKNAQLALGARLASDENLRLRFESLEQALGVDGIQRIECFDISHTQGEATVASCVVFDRNGPVKADYRRFNIGDITPGDDYAAMHQALSRRYQRLRDEQAVMPDLILIDGGKGQLAQALDVLDDLGLSQLRCIGVAKGSDRRAGDEQLILPERRQALRLPPDSLALHLIQSVRDEAHRFAITGHRQRRGKARQQSGLEQIEGVGAKRRAQLLKHFGGLRELSRAGVEEIARVPGISKALAQRIHDALQAT